MAPEKIDRKYSFPSDIWSCGVIMYALMSGRTPFNGDDDNLILKDIF